MKNRITLFIFCFVVWMFLVWPFDWQHALTGAVVSCLVVFMVGDLFTGINKYYFQANRYFWFLFYLVFLIWECLKSNLDVAFRVLNPGYAVSPGIVKIKTNLKSATALAFLANSLTLSPGAISVDIDREKGILYVHWINVKTDNIDKATQILSSRFEGLLKRVFE